MATPPPPRPVIEGVSEPATPAPAATPDLATAMAAAWRFDIPEPELPAGVVGARLWATSYFVPRVEAVGDGVPLVDPSGIPLGPRLSIRDWCDAAMEGTVLVADPASGARATYNFAATGERSQVSCAERYPRHHGIEKSRFRVAIGPYGDGVQGMALVPYRSIAVDPAVIPFGSVVYVPAARGLPVRLPTGEERAHDGYFFAADRGGAIRGAHIDVFTGVEREPPLEFVTSRESDRFDAYRVTEPTMEAMLRRAHGVDGDGAVSARQCSSRSEGPCGAGGMTVQ